MSNATCSDDALKRHATMGHVKPSPPTTSSTSTTTTICRGGSFVSMVAGDAFVAAALCMHQQMQLVRSVCPYILVYDDVRRPLSNASMQLLTESFGSEALFPVSGLMRAVGPLETTSTIDDDGHSPGQAEKALKESVPSPHGRRLYSDSMLTLGKVWLWALPPTRVPVAFHVDLDMLLLENIDDVLSTPIDGPIMGKLCSKSGFSTGIFLFRPNASLLAGIGDLIQKKSRLPRVCEQHATDQSILNAALWRQFRQLPEGPRYNYHPKGSICDVARIVHFSGEPKPWAANAFAATHTRGYDRRWIAQYKHVCNASLTAAARAISS